MTTLDPALEEKFRIYEALLKKWQGAINLVGPATLDDIRGRHLLDSLWLMNVIGEGARDTVLADLGSGAGFPGMVLAMAGMRHVHLVESDTRKAVFLETVARETGTHVTVHNARIEACSVPGVGLVTARALAPLSALLGHLVHLSEGRPGVRGLFPKGAKVEEEIALARENWQFSVEIHRGTGTLVDIRAVTAKHV